jgi:hypothetical protein
MCLKEEHVYVTSSALFPVVLCTDEAEIFKKRISSVEKLNTKERRLFKSSLMFAKPTPLRNLEVSDSNQSSLKYTRELYWLAVFDLY